MERMGGFNSNMGENLPSYMIGLEKDNQTKMEFFDDKKSEKEIQKYKDILKKEAEEAEAISKKEGINVKLLKKNGDVWFASGFTLEEYKKRKELGDELGISDLVNDIKFENGEYLFHFKFKYLPKAEYLRQKDLEELYKNEPDDYMKGQR